MPITIDPQVALLVIDLQEGLLDAPTIHPVRDIAVRAGELAHAFWAHGLPVVFVDDGRSFRGFERGWTDRLPELGHRDSDHVVTKTQVSAFHQGTGVTQVVVAGISTSMGVEAAARGAHDHGFLVAIASDAITERSRVTHENGLKRVLPKLGQVATNAEIIAALPG